MTPTPRPWALLLLAACQAAAPRPAKRFPVPSLGIRLAVPADSKLEDGGGPDSVRVRSRVHPECIVMLWREDPAEGWDALQADLRKGRGGVGRVRKMEREERRKDGSFRVEWIEESVLDKTRLLHAVRHRVRVGDELIGCGRKTVDPLGQACVRAACESIEAI
jgi:hypothetical protein